MTPAVSLAESTPMIAQAADACCTRACADCQLTGSGRIRRHLGLLEAEMTSVRDLQAYRRSSIHAEIRLENRRRFLAVLTADCEAAHGQA